MKERHPDFIDAEALAYRPSGFTPSHVVLEKESQEYGALDFMMEGMRIKFRVGKVTPTKVGQFVTLWKRLSYGTTFPYHIDDPIDLVIISARHKEHFGQFVFPKATLVEQGIFSTYNKEGKRGFRIYPPWDQTDNRTATKTQNWQLRYFFPIHPNQPVDTSLVRKLFLKDH